MSAMALVDKARFLTDDDRKALRDGLQRVLDHNAEKPERAYARALQAWRDGRREMTQRAAANAAMKAKYGEINRTFSTTPAEMVGSAVRSTIMVRGLSQTYGGASFETAFGARYTQAVADIQPLLQELIDFRGGHTFGLQKASQFSDKFLLAAHGGAADVETLKLLKVWRNTVDPMVMQLKQRGFLIPTMQNHFPQTHDIGRIVANKDAWVGFMEQHLDRAEFPDPVAAAWSVYDTLLNRHTMEPDGSPLTLGRVLNFDTPEAAVEYARKFGVGPPHEVALGYLRSLSKKVELVEQFGAKPEEGFERITLIADRALRDARAAGKNVASQQDALVEARKAFEAVNNPIQHPWNQTGAAWFTAADSAVRAMVLGKVALYHATADVPVTMGRILMAGGGFKGISDFARGLYDAIGPKRYKDFVQDYGAKLYHTGAAYHAMSAAQRTGDTVGSANGRAAAKAVGVAAAADDWVQRASFAHDMRDVTRAAAAYAIARNFSRHLDTQWGDLHKGFRAIAQASGITEASWGRLMNEREAALDPVTGALRLDKLSASSRRIVGAHLWRESELAIVNPGMSQRIQLSAYDAPNSAMSALVQRGRMFLASPLSVFQHTMVQSYQIYGFAGAATALGGLLLGGLAYAQLRSLMDTGDTYALDNPELATKALSASGAMSPIGEQLLKAFTPGERAQAVPLLGAAGTAGQDSVKAFNALIDGDNEKAAFRLGKATLSLTPNLWWSRAVTDRAMMAAAESADPNYAAYKQQQAEKRKEGWLQ